MCRPGVPRMPPVWPLSGSATGLTGDKPWRWKAFHTRSLSPGKPRRRSAYDCVREVERNTRPARMRLPAPEEPKALAMPAGKGLWGDNRQGFAPVEPVAEPDEGQAGGMHGMLGRHMALLIQRELLAEKEVFRRKRSTGA